jgi:hypothetical protein
MILNTCTHAFVVPGQLNIIDLVNPETGLAAHTNEDLEAVRLRHPGTVMVDFSKWLDAKAAIQNEAVEWSEVTEDVYHDSMDVLPPRAYTHLGFLVGEPSDHHATGFARYPAFASVQKRYFSASRPMMAREFHALTPAAVLAAIK